MVDAQPVRALIRFLSESHDPLVTGRTVFLNAELPQLSGEQFNDDARALLNCEQAQRGLFLELEEAGFNVKPQLEFANGSFHEAWVNLGKFKTLNEHNIIRALALVKTGGWIRICGAKHSGIASIKKWLSREFEIVATYSKYHSQVICIHSQPECQLSGTNPIAKNLESNGIVYQSHPGLFSADRIDAGSKILTAYLDASVYGNVADLGSGWGYLSSIILTNCEKIQKLHLYETEWWGVEISKTNLELFKSSVDVSFHWNDIVKENVGSEFRNNFDWVIMNPPFHEGRKSNAALGESFISTAAKILKPSGRLLMVSNRKLPYEAVLAREFKNIKTLKETDQYKIILARR